MSAARGGLVRIASITRTVPDLGAAVRFYKDALHFTLEGSPRGLTAGNCALLGVETSQVLGLEMSLGQQRVTLVQFTPQGRAYPPESTSTDLWFQHCAIVVGDMARAHRQVSGAGGLPISDGPQRLPANTGGVTAFKFRDPFGHPLELLSLPEHVGDPAWHRADPSLFLGIDHTALAVSDAAASSRFYTDVIGFTVDGRTHNDGVAQTRLDAVPTDDVDVIALAPAEAPPHLELLGYRTGTRRPLVAADPADAAVSRTIAAGHVDEIAARLTRHGHELRRGIWQDRSAIAFQDSDGHAWICHEP